MSSACLDSDMDVLPAAISYREVQDLGQQSGGRCWSLFNAPIEKLGLLLRNMFYLPGDAYFSGQQNNTLEDTYQLDQALAKKITNNFTEHSSSSSCSEKEGVVKTHFTMRDVEIRIEGEGSKIFTVRVFVSKQPVNDKRLRLVLFSFYGNKEEVKGNLRKWEPRSLAELGKSPLLVLKALQNQKIKVDSLITASLGNVFWDCFRTASLLASDREAVPSTVVINRGLTSVKKVADQYFFPLNYLLYGAAKLTGWDADPEQGMLNFFENGAPKRQIEQKELTEDKQTEIVPLNAQPSRKVIIIEALKDHYFSGKGGFAPDYHKKLSDLGARVYRACFYPFPYHDRSHHALSLDLVAYNYVTKILANTANLHSERDEAVSSFIARNIFLEGDQGFHTCFYICGNDATLDIATVRDSFPLLEAFVKEGQKENIENGEKEAC